MKKTLSLFVLFAASLCLGQATEQVTNLNVAGTFGTGNAQAKGQGGYVLAGHDEAAQCLKIFISNDGVVVKPLFSPIPPLGCLFYGSGSDTAVRDPSVFRAPWNNLYYVVYTPQKNASVSEYFGLASSPDLVNWTGMSQVSTVVTGSTSSQNTWAPQWSFDNATNCATQDYHCTHVYVGISVNGTLGYSGGCSANANNGYYETHPTNSGMTAWSTPVLVGGAPQTACSYDSSVIAVGSTYYALFIGSDHFYHLYSSSSPTTGFTDGGAISAFTCTLNGAGYCEAANWVQSDTTTLRAYFHDTGSGGSVYFSEVSTASLTNTGFGAQVAVTGSNAYQVNHLEGFRSADLTTLNNVVGRAFQNALPLDTPLGDVACGDMALFSFQTSSFYVGNCWGLESVASYQNFTDWYDATRIIGSSSANSESQHVDIGHYTGAIQNAAPSAPVFVDSSERASCSSSCSNGGHLGSNWTQSTTNGLNITTAGITGGNADNYKAVGWYSAQTFAANQSATVLCSSGGSECGAAVRGSGTSTSISAYVGYYYSGGNWYIAKFVSGGSFTPIGTFGTTLCPVPTAPYYVTVAAIGTTLSVYYNGTLCGTTTDSSLTSGSPGLFDGSSGSTITGWVGGGPNLGVLGTGWVDWAQFTPTIASFGGNIATAGQKLNSVNYQRLAANFTFSTNTSLTAFGPTWTIPMSTTASIHCAGSYSQATAAATDGFGWQVSSTPTNVYGRMRVSTSSTAFSDQTVPTSTATTAVTIGTFTPSAFGSIGTVADIFGFDLWLTVENGSTGPTTITPMVLTGSTSDAITIYRGSYCELEP